jgi:hypothetical protein
MNTKKIIYVICVIEKKKKKKNLFVIVKKCYFCGLEDGEIWVILWI